MMIYLTEIDQSEMKYRLRLAAQQMHPHTLNFRSHQLFIISLKQSQGTILSVK